MIESIKPVAIMCFSSGEGGMERSAVRLARFLSSITRVVLVCKKNSFVEKLCVEEAGDITCESISFVSRTFSLRMLFEARYLIQKYEIRNVIFFGASELKTLYFSFINRNVNLIVWHGTTKSKSKRDFFHRLVYSNVNYHVALSNHLLNNVKMIVPVNDNVNYRVIRPSFDFEVRHRNDAGNSNVVINIVHLGRIAPGKGQVDAVKACGLLKKNGIKFKLTLVGASDGGQYEHEVKTIVQQSGLSDCVFITGYVANVNQYLEQADVFLFPSSGEGMPNAFIEALHYNIVCIAYNNTVFPEFIAMGFYLHLVPDRSVADLSSKLLDVVSHLHEEHEKTLKNAELARGYFQKDREINDWIKILV